MFFWEASQELEEERSRGLPRAGRLPEQIGREFIRNLRIDNLGGMLASQAAPWCIIIVGASVLNAGGITSVNSAADAAKALAPLVHTFPHAGALAELLFAIGILNLGLLAVPVLAGSSAYAVSEVAGWAEGLNLNVRRARGFYCVIALGSLVGLAINFVGLNPVKNAGRRGGSERDRGSPLIAVLAVISRSSKIMGTDRSGWVSTSLGLARMHRHGGGCHWARRQFREAIRVVERRRMSPSLHDLESCERRKYRWTWTKPSRIVRGFLRSVAWPPSHSESSFWSGPASRSRL